MQPLVKIIFEYESDTFDAHAAQLTHREAEIMAELLYKKLCAVVEQGGQLSCDGTWLAYTLDTIRNS